MDNLIANLFELAQGTLIGEILTVIALLSLLATHIVPHLPPSITERIPNIVMKILNSLAGQYRFSKNLLTDIKGNRY